MIRCLTKDTCDQMRASSTIGSLTRAVEELVRNSIVHGKAHKIIIEYTTGGARSHHPVNMSTLQVTDDGIGIDIDALQKYIGETYCSSVINDDTTTATSVTSSSDNCDDNNDESRKSVSSSSSPYFSKYQRKRSSHSYGYGGHLNSNKEDVDDGRNGIHSTMLQQHGNGATLLALVTLSHQVTISSIKKQYVDVKRFCNGEVVSFTTTQRHQHDLKMTTNNVSSPHSGTSITITGLFHRHAVRSKHQQICHEQHNHRQQQLLLRADRSVSVSSTSAISHQQRSELSHVRNCLKVLAFAYPHVDISFHHIRRQSLDSSLKQVSSSNSHSLVEQWPVHSQPRHDYSDEIYEQRSYITNISDKIGLLTGFESICHHLIPIRYQCSFQKYSKSSMNSKWHLSGVISNLESNCSSTKRCQHIFVNGRPVKSASVFISAVDCAFHSIKHESGMCHHVISFLFLNLKRLTYIFLSESIVNTVFVFHISCPNQATDTIIEDSLSFISIRDKECMKNFLHNAIIWALLPGKRKHEAISSTFRYEQRRDYLLNEINPNRPLENSSASLAKSKIIAGNYIRLPKCDANRQTENTNTQVEKRSVEQLSPFSLAFFDNQPSIPFLEEISEPPRSNHKSALKNPHDINKNKFEIIDADQNLQWTRNRIKTFEAQISKAISKDPIHRSNTLKQCTITKNMLSNARVIAHLDNKFIVLIMDNVLCLVDQHAADERVRLERHEKELEQLLTRSNNNLSISTHPSILQWRPTTFERIKLNPPKLLKLSLSLYNTAYQYRDILIGWNFNLSFGAHGDKRTSTTRQGGCDVYVETLPSLCGKSASIKADLLPFLQSLDHRSKETKQVRPPFVKRILASQACRYAIMFGDQLDISQCRILVDNLSKCDLSFVCAHGRPSIVPLLNLEEIEKIGK